MKVFVTGGAGFLGQRLVSSLLQKGMQVTCLVRSSTKADGLEKMAGSFKPGQLSLVTGNLSKPDTYLSVLEGCDVLYHLAAELRGAPATLVLGNVVNTRILQQAAARAQVRRFVLVSSLGVYGTGQLQPWDPLDESCPVDPQPHLRDPYSYSKIMQEQVSEEMSRTTHLPVVVIRPGVIYGPGRGCLSARVGLQIGKWLMKMGGRQQLPYTYVENCAEGVLLAGTTPGVEGEVFNLVDDDLPTANLVLARYQKSVRRIPKIWVPRWAISPLSGMCEWYHRYSQGQLPAVLTRYKSAAQWKPLRYLNSKAKKGLSWRPAITTEEGLKMSLQGLADHTK